MAGKSTITLEPEVIDVLKRSSVKGNVLTLPPAKLERSLYVKVDKAIGLIGGKWSRGKRGHVFEGDSRERLRAIIDAGEVVDEVKLYQFYPTPTIIAKHLSELAIILPENMVLEPSAGSGQIVKELFPCRVDVCEIQTKFHVALAAMGATVVGSDFMAYDPGPIYDRIVANPPFTNNQDVKHILHMLAMLKPKGRLVSIFAGSDLDSVDKYTWALVERLEWDCSKFDIEAIDEGAFKESGTGVRTSILIADKR